ncbi:MAG: Nif3-like dinuclear metal center hexameric protein [Christensenellales bacterium]
MKLAQIIRILEANAPLSLAEEWDNSGLSVGSVDSEIKKILVCVDVTPSVVEEAKDKGCNLIVSHHPVIFHPISRVVQDDMTGKVIALAIKNEINIYSMHTNLDCVTGGINSRLAVELGLTDRDGKDRCWRTGRLPEPLTLKQLAQRVGKIMGDNNIKTAGNPDGEISVVAVCSGAGGRMDEMIDEVLLPHGVQAFITAEVKHSLLLNLLDKSISLIETGHWTSEKISKNIICDWLEGADVEVVVSETDADPYNR